MGIDWPLVFEGTKTLLDPIAASSWPIAIGFVVWRFRKPIELMIGRVRQFSGFGTTAEFGPTDIPSQQKEATNTSALSIATSVTSSNSPPSDPVFDILDDQLKSVLDESVTGDDSLKLAWAIRQRSISEATRIHETNYRLIFGSQIFALKMLNTAGPSSVSEFEKYYNENVLTNPQWEGIHKGRTFAQWGQFLLDVAYVHLLNNTHEPMVEITHFGKQFLQWMINVGASEFKAG